jgi:dTDP-4-dehydrorhamnose 3,5-epimerase
VNIEETILPGVLVISPRIFPDKRGFFQQIYHEKEYFEAGIRTRFVQDNFSRSARGTLRGLHYQLKHAQAKLVSVVRGEVLDVVVDIRRGSPAFGETLAMRLSGVSRQQLYIPRGFAHGFCVLSESADFFYKCDDFYAPGDEYGVLWSDPVLGIDWPEMQMELSEKDLMLPELRDVGEGHLPVYAP